MTRHEPDPDKLRAKIDVIRGEISRLQEIHDRGPRELLQSRSLRVAIHSIQSAVEAVLDTASHIVAHEKLGIPETHRESVRMLVDAAILSRKDAGAFDRLIGFRNRAVYSRAEIRPEEVFAIIESDLPEFETFNRVISNRYIPGRQRSSPRS